MDSSKIYMGQLSRVHEADQLDWGSQSRLSKGPKWQIPRVQFQNQGPRFQRQLVCTTRTEAGRGRNPTISRKSEEPQALELRERSLLRDFGRSECNPSMSPESHDRVVAPGAKWPNLREAGLEGLERFEEGQ